MSLERRRIAVGRPGRRAGRPARRQSSSSAVGVELAAGPGDLLGELRADARHVAERRDRGVEHPPGRAEPLEQGPAGRAARRRDHRQADQVEQVGSGPSSLGGHASRSVGAALGSRSSPRTRPDVGLGRARRSARPGRSPRGRTNRICPPLVLLVAAHRVEQGVGVEAGGGGRQAEPLEQGDEPGGRPRGRSSRAARPAGTRRPCRRRPPRRAGTRRRSRRPPRSRGRPCGRSSGPPAGRSPRARPATTTSALSRQLCATTRRSAVGLAGRGSPSACSSRYVEELGVEDHAVLDHLGQPAAELAGGQRGEASRCRSRRRPAGGRRR